MNKQLYIDIGNRFKEKRIELNLTQEEVSKRIGKDRSTYTWYEKGRYALDIETFIKICSVLKIDPYEMLEELQ